MRVSRFLQLTALLLTGALVLAACGDDDSDSGSDGAADDDSDLGSNGLTVDDLVATWNRLEAAGAFQRFAADGTYSIANSPEDLDAPRDQGEFTFDGEVVSFVSGDGTVMCQSGERGEYQVNADGADLLLTRVFDNCDWRDPLGTVYQLVPITP